MNFQRQFLAQIQIFLTFFLLLGTVNLADQKSVNFIAVQWVVLEEIEEKKIKVAFYKIDEVHGLKIKTNNIDLALLALGLPEELRLDSFLFRYTKNFSESIKTSD